MIDITQDIQGFSLALYSTWFFCKPYRLLFDCGEGAATLLERRSCAINYIFLSHGHIDHLAGLLNVIHIRGVGVRDGHCPLTICYPKGDGQIESIRDYLPYSQPKTQFPIHWLALENGQTVDVKMGKGQRQKSQVTAFATNHINGQLTLGYHLSETSRKLKQEFRHLPHDEIQQRIYNGQRDEMITRQKRVLLTFSGDTVPLDVSHYRDSEILIHEATHFSPGIGHSTIDQAVALAVEVKPQQLLLYHLSSRYTMERVVTKVTQACQAHAVSFPVWLQYREHKILVDNR